MDFIEAIVIEVSRATVPERPIRETPFPRLHVRRGDGAATAPTSPTSGSGWSSSTWRPPWPTPAGRSASGFRVFDETLAGGGRVKAIVAPGHGWRHPSRDRRAHRDRQAVRGEGPGRISPSRPAASSTVPSRSSWHAGTQAAIRERTGAETGDLILIVADAPDDHGGRPGPAASRAGCAPRARGPRRARVRAGSTASRCTSGTPRAHRWDATHNPFSGVVPEDEELLVTNLRRSRRSRRPDDPAGRARAMQYDIALNGWELGGGSIRIWRRDLLERSFGLQGYTLDQMARAVRRDARRVRVRRAAARRDRAGHRPLGGAVRVPDEHPRGHGVPEDAVGQRPDAGGARAAGAGAVGGAGPAVRRRHASARDGTAGWHRRRGDATSSSGG